MKWLHLKPVADLVKAAPCREPPPPWRRLGVHAVGGLLAVGFGSDSDLLLVVSSDGRGVFDGSTGALVARDQDEDAYDAIRLEALGLGPLDGQRVRMSGLEGGGLPTGTEDGWTVERLVLEWPLESCLVVAPGSWGPYGILHDKPHDFTKVSEDAEVRAWGFSPTGCTLVLATSSDVTLFDRETD